VKVKEDVSGASGYKPHNNLLINPIDEPSPMWYDYGKNLAGRDSSIFDLETPLTNHQRSSLAKKYRSLADEICRVELNLIDSSAGGKAGSDERWVENTMKKGTLKDRIAATSVLVSTDPIHKLSATSIVFSVWLAVQTLVSRILGLPKWLLKRWKTFS
jgi:ribosome biogenesis protein MAK21